MNWPFDQNPNVACVAGQSVLEGGPVLAVVHYKDDHSWAFLDGGDFDPAAAKLVSMSTVVERHPDLAEIADLPPGWSAQRSDASEPWIKAQDDQSDS